MGVTVRIPMPVYIGMDLVRNRNRKLGALVGCQGPATASLGEWVCIGVIRVGYWCGYFGGLSVRDKLNLYFGCRTGAADVLSRSI